MCFLFLYCHSFPNIKKTNIIHMTTSVPRKLNILCIMFKIIAFFIITLFARLYVRVDILLLYEKLLHDHIISLRGEVWDNKISLTPPLFIEIPVPSQECDQSCIVVLGLSILHISTSFLLDCGTVLSLWYFLFFILFHLISNSLLVQNLYNMFIP